MKNSRKSRTRIRFKRIFLLLLILLLGVFLAVSAFLYFRNASAELAKEDISYTLFIGTDPETDSQADAILLTVSNRKTQEVSFVSIPANISISSYDKEKKQQLLRDVYGSGGTEAMKSAVENMLHIRIDKYAVFTPEDFIYFIDQANGLQLYVEQNMQHVDADGNIDIDIHQGFQNLDGNTAFEYARFLDQKDGELGRIQRQERLLKNFISVLQDKSALMNWLLVKYYWKASETNLSSSEAADFVYHLTNIPSEHLRYEILPGEKSKVKNQETWVINPVEVQELLV